MGSWVFIIWMDSVLQRSIRLLNGKLFGHVYINLKAKMSTGERKFEVIGT